MFPTGSPWPQRRWALKNTVTSWVPGLGRYWVPMAACWPYMSHTATGPVNIGNPVEFTVLSLAELVIEMTGSTSRIESVTLPVERTGDPAQRCPDISTARSLLGWEPTVTLQEGLAGMIDHFRSVELIA